MIKLIIWDYNGTVLDDVDTSVAAVNEMLKKRNLPLTNKNIYIQNLNMPLDDYYASIGIKNISISELSLEFRENCIKHKNLSGIFEDFFPAITKAKKQNINNILLSSLYHEFLKEDTENYKITEYFDYISGCRDTSVGSKTSLAKEYIEKHKIKPEEVVFIGDLPTDAKTAAQIGAKCILVPRGHCCKTRCEDTGVKTCNSLIQAIEYLICNY